MKNKTCYICGKSRADSKDHVPPRSIFPNIPKGQLMTLYAHTACNEMYSADDDLFKNLIIMNSYGNSEAAREAWSNRIVPSWVKDPGAKRKLLDRVTEVERNGLMYPAIKIDGDLVQRQVVRWFKALYFKKLNHTLPENLKVIVNKLQEPNVSIKPYMEDMARKGIFPKWVDIEPNIFSYNYMTSEEDENLSYAIFLFFETEVYMASIGTE